MSDAVFLGERLAVLLQPRHLILMAFLLAAAFTDARQLRIPNALTGAGAGLALLLSAWPGARAELGLASALGGLALGLALMLPLYLGRVIGAGDAKLIAMVGAFLGLAQMPVALVFIAIAGGLLALAAVARRRAWRALRRTCASLLGSGLHGTVGVQQARLSVGRLPCAVGICLGVGTYLLMRTPGPT